MSFQQEPEMAQHRSLKSVGHILASAKEPAMFKSTEEIFKSAREIIACLEKDGSSAAAWELREGFGALNGLTDGWAAFLESIDRVLRDYHADMKPEQQETLKLIREAAYYAVYRRKPGPWWKFW